MVQRSHERRCIVGCRQRRDGIGGESVDCLSNWGSIDREEKGTKDRALGDPNSKRKWSGDRTSKGNTERAVREVGGEPGESSVL
ncbi:hypothetical protein GDO78_018871 [Eleutherodactylus coqui]|uniref:Uncharacterized protein n=1 Tax=Eleutherodactylus coqui TaxID=57060 RepID=A0A8J6B8H4_ELECQ|nr:hypothetical protein GDO78_018871 [Eleutherodactylus coqui]